MRQRHLRVLARRLAMHERRGAERRRSDEVRAEHVGHVPSGETIRGAETHDQIVWVLIVHERRAVITLSSLKQLRRSAGGNALSAHVHEFSDGERFERQHGLKRQPAAAQLPLSSRHEPVLRFPRGRIGEESLLIVVADEDVGIGCPRPGRECRRGGCAIAGLWRILCNGGCGDEPERECRQSTW
jgi:hypothetical protein